ncbi:MAG: outer membrane protein assembly factor BamE [Jhaorihella sp.]
MMASVSRLARPIRVAIVGAAVASLAACASVYRDHGYVPTDAELAEIKVGVDTRDSVTEAVGPPSAGGVLDNSGYYYVSSRIRHYGARQPQVVSRELVAVSFDQRGVVRNIERYGLENGQVITISRRVTSSSVEDKTFLRQLLGNLGRFNPGSVLD